jgi:hypothetical protein
MSEWMWPGYLFQSMCVWRRVRDTGMACLAAVGALSLGTLGGRCLDAGGEVRHG